MLPRSFAAEALVDAVTHMVLSPIPAPVYYELGLNGGTFFWVSQPREQESPIEGVDERFHNDPRQDPSAQAERL